MKRPVLKDDRRLQISPVTTADVETLLDYARAVGGESDFLTFGAGEFDMSVADEVAFIEAVQQRKNLLVKGEVDGAMVSLLNVDRGARPRVAHLGELGITVRKALWGQGVGKQMLRAGLDWAREAGLRKLNLKVRHDNARAIALYERFGFVREGRQARGYRIADEFFDDLCMGLVVD
ncbi:MAG: GNAT family N-acetyltransferase [Deltaproteobacteria bacterium]|nr:GNAT family N-acetyltransferase [Deltaproteobacteria bacterium]